MKKNHPGRMRAVVATNIRRLRNALGVSQQDFALSIGMDRTYLGGVERGERNVAIDNLERIAAGLRVEPWELLRDWKSEGTGSDEVAISRAERNAG